MVKFPASGATSSSQTGSSVYFQMSCTGNIYKILFLWLLSPCWLAQICWRRFIPCLGVLRVRGIIWPHPQHRGKKKHTLIFEVMKTVWKSLCIPIVLTHQTDGKRSSKLSKSCTWCPFGHMGAKYANVLSSETKMLVGGCSERLNGIMEYHRLMGYNEAMQWHFNKLVRSLFYSIVSIYRLYCHSERLVCILQVQMMILYEKYLG